MSAGLASRPTISVILPVYNAERYVAQAVESILNQTFRDFELILIDDGSTDGSLEILRRYAERDSRIVLINRENRGLVTSLNEGIDLARGQWIARMDADDISLPQRFERQLQWLIQTGADICGSWARLFGTASQRTIKHPQSDEAIRMELLFGAPFAHPTVVMKTDHARKLHYDKAWETCEDYDLWERAARNGWKMANVPETLLLYRQHAAQISTASLPRQLKLAQQIRRRYWTYTFDLNEIKKTWIDEVLRLRDPNPGKVKMHDVDAVFNELLQRKSGEARETVFAHMTKLYFRAAGCCPDVAERWGVLNEKFGNGSGLSTKMKLKLLSTLRIRADSTAFDKLKKISARFNGQ